MLQPAVRGVWRYKRSKGNKLTWDHEKKQNNHYKNNSSSSKNSSNSESNKQQSKITLLPPPLWWLAVELRHLCGVENLNSARGEWSYHPVWSCVPGICYMARHPRSSYIVFPLLSREVATPGKKKKIGAVIHMQERPALQVARSRMQLTLHATRWTPQGASRFVRVINSDICRVGENPTCSVPAL